MALATDHPIIYEHGNVVMPNGQPAHAYRAWCRCGWKSPLANQQKAILYGRRHRWFVVHGTTPWDDNPFNHKVKEAKRAAAEGRPIIIP